MRPVVSPAIKCSLDGSQSHLLSKYIYYSTKIVICQVFLHKRKGSILCTEVGEWADTATMTCAGFYSYQPYFPTRGTNATAVRCSLTSVPP